MELQDQLKNDWSRYFCDRPPLEFDKSSNHHLLCSELKSSSVRPEGDSDPYCSIWKDAERARIKNCNNRSFAMDARMRLDSLKSGCNLRLPCNVMGGMLHNYNCQKDLWDSDESQEEESALDLVELLDVEDDVKDEENWLYESPKKQVLVESTESALAWSRHVLDNPSPDMEAACHSLITRLDQRSSSHFYRRPADFQRSCSVSVGSSLEKTSVSTTHNTSDSTDNNALSYRLQDITDVHIMARIQEASLRQDYVSTPATASSRRGESPMMFPSYLNSTVESTDGFTSGDNTEASSSSCYQPGLSSLSSSPCQLPTSVTKQGCQSLKLARLHQQVTQFKLLKLAQNQATSPGRTRSPLRTSLRSLQAVRNSRSLETDDYQPADSQITYPPSGASSVRKQSSCWSPSLSAASINSKGSSRTARDSSDRTAAVKRLQRSQSVSPCRIPHPAKGYLSVHGRIFASPERSTTVAWARNVPSNQR
ncbi:SLAIN motif-containing protein-like isoform X1 [Chaetodon trifascialis]|uniref:SLAIN motif-containing protein-like isoform X1 n=1 Tax=Chaetodon trifascialis TaxID=109706 RepID=UPI003995F129